MSSTRYASVVGLSFGDCGKGHFVDALTRRWNAHTVVRFNGGAQAGHNVVTRAHGNTPAKHHTFSQFGAGTLVPGVRTVLIDPMILHPTALLLEAEFLSKIGVNDALSRLTIDAQCRITTPFHQAAGRLREMLRGAAAHGTCGVGVGETVRHGLNHPDQEIRYSDLPSSSGSNTFIDRLQTIRETLLAEFAPLSFSSRDSVLNFELQMLRDETIAAKWMARACPLVRQCPPASSKTIRRQLLEPGCVLVEGAQGALLDEWRGFHPYTTWSSINTAAVESVMARFVTDLPIEHYGVLRSYLTRHGVGRLPTHDVSLDWLLPEPHNLSEGWQGAFRRGQPDAVLLRYAIETVGRLAGLFISHLDVFQRGISLTWCDRYSVAPDSVVDRLPVAVGKDLNHQLSLTRLLQNAQPQYATKPISSDSDFLERIAEVTSLPVVFGSYGPACTDVREQLHCVSQV